MRPRMYDFLPMIGMFTYFCRNFPPTGELTEMQKHTMDLMEIYHIVVGIVTGIAIISLAKIYG